jgi:hypothetical protein
MAKDGSLFTKGLTLKEASVIIVVVDNDVVLRIEIQYTQ